QPSDLFANPFSRVGYDFAGWTLDQKWTGKLYANQERVENLTAAENGVVGLYAQWNPHAYYINFEPNGASGLMIDQKAFYGNATSLSPLAYDWENWHFMGWNTAPDGSGTSYADGQEISNLSAEEGARITLFAQWSHDMFSLTFDPNGGKGDPQTIEVWNKSGYPVPLCAFEREGYTFTEWNTAPDGSGTPYAVGTIIDTPEGSAAAMTFYAQWSKDPVPGPGPVQPGDDPQVKPNQNPRGLATTGDANLALLVGGIALACCLALAAAFIARRRLRR
ncbi:MAG: InlB B-repeat-containing protein, partial [Raoultibacter sp.]